MEESEPSPPAKGKMAELGMAGADAAEFHIEGRGNIRSVGELLSEMQGLRGPKGRAVYFRGLECCTCKLVPTIGRTLRYIGRQVTFTRDEEQNLLHRFRRCGYHHVGRVLGEWEALLLARHHGLPVRLLDWSSNPLVALLFASVHEETTQDGALWALVRPDPPYDADIDIPSEKRRPFDVTGIRLLYPISISPRISAQSCYFTIQNPWIPVEERAGELFPRGQLDLDHLVKWCIPACAKPRIIVELQRLGVSRRTLFPDLDGLANDIWQLEAVRGMGFI